MILSPYLLETKVKKQKKGRKKRERVWEEWNGP